LNNLAALLSEVGRQAEALGHAQAAVERYRALAARHPELFTPELALSTGVLARSLEANDQREEALARFAEGVRVLAPPFEVLPEAHAPLMRTLVADYQRLAQALGQTPDAALLEPVLARLEAAGTPVRA
jgi:tetratricopeptide (TPR) repeat protein